MKLNIDLQTRTLYIAKLATIISVLLIYARSFSYQYVEFDDPFIIFDNPHIQSLNLNNLVWMFTDHSYNNLFYMPLMWLFYAFSGMLFSFNPEPQHVINVLIHIANALLVFEILRLIIIRQQYKTGTQSEFFSIWVPLVGALFWAVHPLRVEAIGWISARVHLHASLFAFAACWAFLQVCGQGKEKQAIFKQKMYWLAVIFYGLSMWTFPTAIMLPAVLALYDWYSNTTDATPISATLRIKKIAWEMTPFILVGIIPTAISMAGNIADSAGSPTATKFGILEHLLIKCYMLWHYLGATLLPINLSPAYTQLIAPNPHAPIFLLSALLVVGVSVGLFIQRKKWPALWCAWLCYIVFMIPYVRILGDPRYASDRYSYFHAIIWSILLLWPLSWVFNAARPAIRRMIISVTVCVLAVLSGLSFHQLRIWENSEVFFPIVISRVADDFYKPDLMWRLARHYVRSDQLDQAEIWLNQAKAPGRISPMMESVELDILKRRCELAAQQAPDTLRSHQIGLLQFCIQNHSEVYKQPIFDALLTTYQALAANDMPTTSAATRKASPKDSPELARIKALAATTIANRLEPGLPADQAGALYDHAREQCLAAIKVAPDASVYESLGLVSYKLGNWDEAGDAFSLAIQQTDNSPSLYLWLTRIRLVQKRFDEANTIINTIQKRWPEYSQTVNEMRNHFMNATPTSAR